MESSRVTTSSPFRDFDIENIRPDSRMIVMGQPGSGKTNFLIDLLLKTAGKFFAVLAIVPTAEAQQMMEHIIPPAFVFKSFDAAEAEIRRLIESQSLRIRAACKEYHTMNGKQYVPNALVLIDDSNFDKTFMKTEAFRALMMNGRQYNIMTLLAFQYPVDLSACLRCNLDYVVTFHYREDDINKKLNTYFFGAKSYKNFCSVYELAARGYRALVIDKKIPRTEFSECVCTYTAASPTELERIIRENPRQRLGVVDPRFWVLDRYYKTNVESVVRSIDDDEAR